MRGARLPATLVLLLALASGCGSCANEEDLSAKARIFSPEDPPKILQAAAETIDPARLADEPALVARVLRMPAREAVARLGAHVQTAKISFRWSLDERRSALTEEHHVALASNGDFHARVNNDREQGMEWIRVGGVSYARSRFATFREKRRDRGSSDHVVDEAYASLAVLDELAHGAVRLTSQGATTVAGRSATKFSVSLGERRDGASARSLPDRAFPKGGPDRDTQLRLEALEKGKVTSLAGQLVVDQQTAVPLQANVTAVVQVPGEEGTARLDLAIELQVDGVGQAPKIAVPEHLPDEARPPGVVAILDAYGLPRASVDEEEGKSAGASPPEEAGDDEE